VRPGNAEDHRHQPDEQDGQRDVAEPTGRAVDDGRDQRRARELEALALTPPLEDDVGGDDRRNGDE
jgi:hypothetical protein